MANWGIFIKMFGGWIAFVAMMGFTVIFLAMTKAASWPLFKAKITGKSLVLLQRKDERYGFVTGTYRGGSVNLGQWGKLACTQNSFKPFAGTTLAQAREGFAAIPTPEYIDAAKNLKEQGYDDLEAVLSDVPNLEEKREDENTPKDEMQLVENIFTWLGVIEDFNETGGSTIVMDDIIDQEVKMKMNKREGNMVVKLLAFAVIIAAIAAVVAIVFKMQQCPTANDFVALANTCARVGSEVSM